MNFTPEFLVLGLAWYAVFLFSLTVHEAAHAWAALRLGDATAYQGGQVTLNPIPHVQREVFGTVIMPLVSYLLAGWMMGWASAPYDPFWADRHPRRAAWMSLAGPASNLLIVLLASLLIRGGMAVGWFAAPATIHFSQVTVAAEPGAWAGAASLLSILFSLNLLLAAFNLLPLPPLDGSGALPLLMPENWARRYQEILREPMFNLLGLILAWKLFGSVFNPLHLMALGWLYPELTYQ